MVAPSRLTPARAAAALFPQSDLRRGCFRRRAPHAPHLDALIRRAPSSICAHRPGVERPRAPRGGAGPARAMHGEGETVGGGPGPDHRRDVRIGRGGAGPGARRCAARHRHRGLALSLSGAHVRPRRGGPARAHGLSWTSPRRRRRTAAPRVLLHGKNFSSDYWADVIADLAGRGYRVVVPDQIGFNKSSKPDLDYSFDALAANTLALLDHLGVRGPGRRRRAFDGRHARGALRAHPSRSRAQARAGGPDRPRGLSREHPAADDRDADGRGTEADAESYRAFIARYFVAYPKDKQEPFVEQRMRIAASGEYDRWAKASAEPTR